MTVTPHCKLVLGPQYTCCLKACSVGGCAVAGLSVVVANRKWSSFSELTVLLFLPCMRRTNRRAVSKNVVTSWNDSSFCRALPPTEDAFEQHALRPQCQFAVWYQSHIAKPVDMDPVGHRLHVNVKDELCPTMYKNKPASAEVRDITHLNCTDKSCRGQKMSVCHCWT